MSRLALLTLLLLEASYSAGEGSARDLDSIIYLTKNTNRNQVHYGVKVDEKCRPLADTPSYAYWRMREKGPEKRAELMFWEQPGYGVRQPKEVQVDAASGSFDLTIRGVPERKIQLKTFSTDSGCKAGAFTKIGGEQAQLERIDIEVSGWANVHKVEIHGHSIDTGLPVSEVTHED